MMLTMTFVAPIIAAAAAATPVPSANRRRRLSRRRHQRHRRGATRRVRDEQGGGGQRTSVTIHRPSHAAAGCWARRYRSLLEKTSKTKFSSPTSCSTGHTLPASSSCVSSSEPSSSADDVPSRPDWAQRTSLRDGAFHCFALHPRRKWSMKNHRNYWRTHKTIHPFFHCSRSTSSSRLQLQCGCGWNEGSRISYLGWGGQRRRGAPGYVVLHRRQPVGASWFGTAAERPVEWESGSERGRDRREHNLAGLVEWAPRVGPGQCISRMRWGKYGIQQIFADIPRPYRVYARILEPSNGGEPRCSCT